VFGTRVLSEILRAGAAGGCLQAEIVHSLLQGETGGLVRPHNDAGIDLFDLRHRRIVTLIALLRNPAIM
jgi:hypothetical protein